MMEGVELEINQNGNGKDPEYKGEIIDASSLQEFDVTATYSFVDSHYHVMLSEENKVSKVVLVRD